jgi:hypothetical protein
MGERDDAAMAASAASLGAVDTPSRASGSDVERTALKEWAVAIDALAHGTLIALVRKGGIREHRAGFAVRHERFLLYPTYFHENTSELAPALRQALDEPARVPLTGMVRVTHVAHVAHVWHVDELDRLRGAEGEHALAWPAVESRFHYRGTPGVHVVAVRVARLRAPANVPEISRYRGCVSWVELAEDIDVAGAEPVLADAEFDRRLATLGHHLERGDIL